MRSAVEFHEVQKSLQGSILFRIHQLKIPEGESAAFYGLEPEVIDAIVHHLTGAYPPEEGSIRLLGIDPANILQERTWFRFFETIGIYSSRPIVPEAASIGENLAMLFRIRNPSIEEPQLSSSVLHLANLTQLTITDLARTLNDAPAILRMKVRLCRAIVYRPRVLVLCDPTNGLTAQASRKLIQLVKRLKRKFHFSVIVFTQNVDFILSLADRVLFLNPQSGLMIENRLRGWYHSVFPFLKPSPARILQLSRDILQYSSMMRRKERL